jgi:hypothetical protein
VFEGFGPDPARGRRPPGTLPYQYNAADAEIQVAPRNRRDMPCQEPKL